MPGRHRLAARCISAVGRAAHRRGVGQRLARAGERVEEIYGLRTWRDVEVRLKTRCAAPVLAGYQVALAPAGKAVHQQPVGGFTAAVLAEQPLQRALGTVQVAFSCENQLPTGSWTSAHSIHPLSAGGGAAPGRTRWAGYAHLGIWYVVPSRRCTTWFLSTRAPSSIA